MRWIPSIQEGGRSSDRNCSERWWFKQQSIVRIVAVRLIIDNFAADLKSYCREENPASGSDVSTYPSSYTQDREDTTPIPLIIQAGRDGI
jgi:hypothetical protein